MANLEYDSGALERHASVRRRGTPLLSILVGDLASATNVARTWAVAAGVPFAAVSSTPEDLHRAVIEVMVERLPVRGKIQEHAARLLGMNAMELERACAASSLERTSVLEALSTSDPLGRLWVHLVLGAASSGPVTTWLRDLLEPHRAVELLHALLPEPELCVFWTSPASLPALALPAAMREASLLAEADPRLHLVIPLREAQDVALRAGLPERLRTLVTLGRARVPPDEGGEPPRARTAEMSPGRARSAAEAFLFTMLEERAATRGLFALNRPWLDVHSGEGYELDFFAEGPRIAVELDGHHHFQDPEQYRRDRRKDRVLQQSGIVVLRFLSEDVVERLEEILRTIEDAVRRRTSEAP